MKIIILLIMGLILFNLGRGLIYLVKDAGKTDRTVKALTWRIGLSLFLFVLLMILFFFGYTLRT